MLGRDGGDGVWFRPPSTTSLDQDGAPTRRAENTIGCAARITLRRGKLSNGGTAETATRRMQCAGAFVEQAGAIE
ncbi:MAG: hypothetical protein AAFX08_02505 [Pseudomonadota bacterium]